MMALEFFRWWYGRGWQLMLIMAGRRLRHLGEAFSVSSLLHTLFAPWRRIISYPGASLDAKLRAMLDNLVSRCIGLVVRVVVLLAAAVVAVVAALVGLIQIVIWPLIPAIVLAAIVMGVR